MKFVGVTLSARGGGVGMTTLAYASVSRCGRTFASQLVLNSEMPDHVSEQLKLMIEEIHGFGGAISVQLTHGGGFASSSVIGKRQVAPSPTFSPSNLSWSRALTEEDLSILERSFVGENVFLILEWVIERTVEQGRSYPQTGPVGTTTRT